MQSFDTETAIGYIGYSLSKLNIVADSNSSLVDLLKQWATRKDANAAKQPGRVLVTSVFDLAATLQQALVLSPTPSSSDLPAATYTSSESLTSIIPILYKLVADAQPHVLHASISKGDASGVFAIRQTGWMMVASAGQQEALDVSVLAHAIATKASLPVLHFYDGKLGNKQIPVSPISFEKLVGLTNDISSSASAAVSSSSASSTDDSNATGSAAAVKATADTNLYLRPSPSATIDQASLLKTIETTIKELNGSVFAPRSYSLFEYTGPSDATTVLVYLGTASQDIESAITTTPKTGAIRVRWYRPWSTTHFLNALPSTVTHIAVIEPTHGLHTGWGPLFLDVASSFQSEEGHARVPQPIVREARVSGTIQYTPNVIKSLASEVTSGNLGPFTLQSHEHVNGLVNGIHQEEVDTKLEGEGPYIKMLHSIFNNRLVMTNVTGAKDVGVKNAEFGFGSQLVMIQQRHQLVQLVTNLIQQGSTSPALKTVLSKWLETRDDAAKSREAGDAVIALLDKNSEVYKLHHLFAKPSYWLVGGDSLAVDIGNSGVHHVIASKEKINMLVVDTQPYSDKKSEMQLDLRKKDIGLYAMNYGGVFVASVAVHSSYAQTLRAFQEADAYPGPSIIVAYSPRVTSILTTTPPSAMSAPLKVIKETKLAVDSGYWPLYRWNPVNQENPFSLDSDKVKAELKSFLERENHFAMVLKSHPEIGGLYTGSAESEFKTMAERKVADSYAQLLNGLNLKPLLILFGSDGGNAERLAKRINAEAKQRGLRPRMMPMDSMSLEDLPAHPNVLFVVSTAGQGEFPGNAREFWKSLSSPPAEIDFKAISYAVMALGDSHYWPLPEDAHYFAKSGKDLDNKLATLGFTPFAKIGISDDQDPDGLMTGYNAFAPSLWEYLGVGEMEVNVESVVIHPEVVKEASNFLRGTLAEGLLDTTTGALSENDTVLTKFHGIYQQDDRDIRDERARQGLEKAFSFMVRVRVPGGIATPQQWIALNNVGDQHANGTVRITTRQAIQFHGIIKRNLKQSIKDINQALMDTVAACGDVNRNVMCNPNPFLSEVHKEVFEICKEFSDHLTPRTSAYHEIWLDKKMVAGSADEEPIYGKLYLPRKFKTAVAIPPSNDVDVFAHDLGYIAIVEDGKLVGFNVSVGGGMGMTHGAKKTFPRLGEVMGFVTVDQVIAVGVETVTVQRDYGDRVNRKHARLKYTIEDRGLDWFRSQVEERLGWKLQPARPYKFTSNGDRYGWNQGLNRTWHYTFFVSNGRIKDTPDYLLKTALMEIAQIHKGDFRLTPNQNLMIANIPEAERPAIEALLHKYKIGNETLSGLRLNSMACVALPTCGLAMAESERYLPDLVTLLEESLNKVGLRHDEITIRMTGCPNGCARPQIAEIGFIGKAPGTYNMYLGGGFTGERLSRLYKENVDEENIVKELAPMFKRYSLERNPNEHFGDFCIRVGIIKAMLHGREYNLQD
ncbi:assimilatory sulfite reductase (NADPH) [Synchytrium microbalum]|uniref:assimilatory sulfite reductase (NADPH) n=1 Tax=Synchytrium microbalum TaxID=1806994 RepID=A0A507BYI3_9FUNG|nr:assimilatory sulfite reductase (NADPH) [Synchytrium microbalum]TPX31919.1 assimilatory sulfite reductase (NADPH) [Synchytrium microbalum]